MTNYIIAMVVILLLMLGWIGVQSLARQFAKRHPEYGPLNEGFACGSSCSCSGKMSCARNS